MAGNTNTVLVADDDPAVVDQLRLWLDDYRVEATTDGDEAIARLATADAVVVDHDLLPVSGAVAAELEHRATTQTMAILCESTDAHNCPFSIGNTLVKPVEKDTVVETVDRLLRRARYDELIAECTTLATKRGALEAGGDTASGARSETVQRDLDELFTELDDLVGTFDSDDFRAAFATCEVGTAIQPRCASEFS
ncbi:HalX domain-containing protein [Natrinema hispanicum]|uniref:Response regulator receiver domain-containing protein n=1 Tax=Natrinema hispanicum TaxID=392421 RepID=A0A1G6MX09_9EURY|nr:HalX domain-containing protein [Natrinema hispanicum]SDC59981.1 Response regulator receiver domain-containing protein [Natrinema hispanicum]SET80547.1 Response regulator receiver domain-containing protein [Natrinema hispanicum]